MLVSFLPLPAVWVTPDEYFFNKLRFDQWVEIRDSDYYQLDHKEDNLKGVTAPNTDYKFGTVGAVACDVHGNLAGGTSTGGMTNKRFGRIGDSPVIGVRALMPITTLVQSPALVMVRTLPAGSSGA